MPCHWCLGEKCPKCKKKGEIEFKTPPSENLTSEAAEYFEFYKYLKNYNIWPATGGLEDQDAKFLKVLKFCDTVNSKIMNMGNEQTETQNKLQALQRKNINGA